MAGVLNFILAIVVIIALLTPFVIMFGGVLLLALWFLLSMKKKPIDQMKMMYQEMVEEAKINRQPNQVELVRYPAPFFGRVLTKINELSVNVNILLGNTAKIPEAFNPTELKENVDNIRKDLETIKQNISGQTAVRMGDVIGFNKFDLLATLEGMEMPTDEKDKAGEKLVKLDEKKKDIIDKIMKECGRYMNFIVYEKDMGGLPFFEKKYVQGVFAFDDQVMGLDSADGLVTLLGSGTTRIGVYFQIPSGYPERIGILLTHLIETSRIRWAMLLESNLIEMTEKASNFDSQFLKLAELNTAKQEVTNKTKE